MDKLLTVSVAAYNGAATLQRALDSCITPNSDQLEVWIIDDGSTDQTAAIAELYVSRYPELFHLYRQTNGGYGSTIEAALQRAKGKYFRTLDCDDWFEAGALENLLPYLASSCSDIVYTNYNMQPVQCTGGYYGLHREYDEQGLNCAITYLDENKQPVICTSGYAVKTYLRDSEGTVIGERYFDTEGKPVKSSFGQYGELYQRDEQGRISQITYLGADGNPTPTNAGYTVMKRTYHRDGTADTDMYFDADGNPMVLSKGQHGIKRSGKVNLLLDKNGHVMLCVDNILNGFPFIVVISGCVICLLILVLPKKMSVLLTAAYIAFILYETLMFREAGDARTNFVLFSYADRFLTEQSVRVGVINNIWLFVPLGAGWYRIIQKKWVLLVPFLMSVVIEATQYITGLGIAEFDDVFGNTMGGWIGVLTAWAWLSRRKFSTLARIELRLCKPPII